MSVRFCKPPGKTAELADLRASITKSFDHIYGFLMPSPGDDFRESAEAHPSTKLLRKQFVDQMKEFVVWAVKVVLPAAAHPTDLTRQAGRRRLLDVSAAMLLCLGRCIFSVIAVHLFSSLHASQRGSLAVANRRLVQLRGPAAR